MYRNGTTSRGTIVNISSILGQVALNGASTYVVSKHGTKSFPENILGKD
jgi:short-subunit dehydrogenase